MAFKKKWKGKKGFLWHAKKVLEESDLIIEVIDARFPEMTRNRETEEKILRAGKKLLIVMNKCDLAVSAEADKTRKEIEQDFPCILFSGRKKKGTKQLRRMIGMMSAKKKVNVGIVGYPNTGKSTVINVLKGKKSAGTGLKSGFTKGAQKVKISQKIMLFDTPGIIPFNERNEFLLTITGAKTIDTLKDLEGTALNLIDYLKESQKGFLKKEFGADEKKDSYEILEAIAYNKNKLLKEEKPDLNSAGRLLVMMWQKGKHSKQ